jgi:ribosomal protein S18 acetylase RimI-like enzyme
MPDRESIPLKPVRIEHDSTEFELIMNWPYADSFVTRLLHDDIPQRLQFGSCRLWIYRDPNGEVVGFGSLDLSNDCLAFSSGQRHTYIPLLAVNPTIKSLGYGTSILHHLMDEAVLLTAANSRCHDSLFLDVYTTSDKALKLYITNGFVQVSPEPIADVQAEGKLYLVLAKRVALALN